jgi:hypothetical protein
LVRWLASIAAGPAAAGLGDRVGLEDGPDSALMASPPRSSDGLRNILVLIEQLTQSIYGVVVTGARAPFRSVK